MPELPEVEHARGRLDNALLGGVVAAVDVEDDSLVFEGVEPAAIREALCGATVTAVVRRGKQLAVVLGGGRPSLCLHLGMTGGVVVQGQPSLVLATGPELGDAWPPKHAKLVLTTTAGQRVAYTCARRFGRVRLRADLWGESPFAGLGPDALTGELGAPRVRAALARRRGAIKPVLLDQSWVAGLGNWLADDVLLEAGIDPHRRASSLKDDAYGRLLGAIRQVVARAVDVDADSAKFPAHWLFHVRWTPREGLETAGGDPIVFTQIAGRTTVWVPRRQA